jgi:hypothetical protein
LEIKDNTSATTAIDIELAPCGMLVEANAGCDLFCENIAREVGTPSEAQVRELVAKSLGNVDETTLQSILKTAREPQPLFPERAFFRTVANE